MTRVLFLSPSDMILEWLEGSLHAINDGQLEIGVLRYDRIGTPVDRGMFDRVSAVRPDIILYTSQADGPYVAAPSTFAAINRIAPCVHLCLDAGDIGFKPLLTRYRDEGCFTYTVATDGCAAGPVDATSFHPVDPRPYQPERGFSDRPIAIGTAIGMPYGLRRDVMTKLQQECGMVIKPREETYGSYRRYCDFLKACKIIPDCALSAGGPEGRGPYARTLKTRAIEVGLAGACLLELRGCALNKWAEEDADYATYETPEEAVAVARDLMANPGKAQEMAERLSRVVREKMNPTIFWSQVFSACGLSVEFRSVSPR
jgi:Glycosyl transferases group 1